MFKKLLHHRETSYQLLYNIYTIQNFQKVYLNTLYQLQDVQKVTPPSPDALPNSKILLLKLLYNIYTIQYLKKKSIPIRFTITEY
jgi:hypothetical protein